MSDSNPKSLTVQEIHQKLMESAGPFDAIDEVVDTLKANLADVTELLGSDMSMIIQVKLQSVLTGLDRIKQLKDESAEPYDSAAMAVKQLADQQASLAQD